jgi:hypothetical protein
MFAPRSVKETGVRPSLELDGLEGLPCGCVAARYKALPWDGHMVRVEAKGPHCTSPQHAIGAVLGFGPRADLLAFDTFGEPDTGDLPLFGG